MRMRKVLAKKRVSIYTHVAISAQIIKCLVYWTGIVCQSEHFALRDSGDVELFDDFCEKLGISGLAADLGID